MHSWNRWGTVCPRFEAMESRAKIIAFGACTSGGASHSCQRRRYYYDI